MENVSFYNDESVVLWQINPLPDYPFFALNQSGSNTNTSDKLTIWNDLSPGTLLVFSFYMLGVGHATIARELGITDRASEDRIKPVKRKIKEFFFHSRRGAETDAGRNPALRYSGHIEGHGEQ